MSEVFATLPEVVLYLLCLEDEQARLRYIEGCVPPGRVKPFADELKVRMADAKKKKKTRNQRENKEEEELSNALSLEEWAKMAHMPGSALPLSHEPQTLNHQS